MDNIAPKIDSFTGEYRFLSNFYPAKVTMGGKVYPSVEHAYQAAKTLDEDDRERIRGLRSAGAAKKAGYKVKLRRDWEAVKNVVMYNCVWSKFTDPILRGMLLGTGLLPLIEGNNWGDTYWGMVDGKGENRLGQILMMIREEIKQDLEDSTPLSSHTDKDA